MADVPWYMRKAAEYIFATPPTSTYEEVCIILTLDEVNVVTFPLK